MLNWSKHTKNIEGSEGILFLLFYPKTFVFDIEISMIQEHTKYTFNLSRKGLEIPEGFVEFKLS